MSILVELRYHHLVTRIGQEPLVPAVLPRLGLMHTMALLVGIPSVPLVIVTWWMVRVLYAQMVKAEQQVPLVLGQLA